MSDRPPIEILDIISLKNVDSQYLKPYRVLYKRTGSQDDKILMWDCIKTHDSVSILIYNTSRNVLVFVRQFRPPVYMSTLFNSLNASFDDLKEKGKNSTIDVGYTLELCAGNIDKDNLTPKEIAREEVIEETGYNPPLDSLELITSFRTGVGSSGSLQYVFYCQVDDSMRISSGGGVDDESIEVIEMTVEESKKHILAKDEPTGIGRNSGFRFVLYWFINEKLPQIQKSSV